MGVDPFKLQNFDLSITDVFTALENGNQNTGSSYIQKGPNAYYIRAEGLLESLEDLKEVVITNWYGVLAPAGTSPQIVERLSQELARIVQLPDVRERLNGAALEPMQSTPQLFSEHIATELSKWEFIVREAKIQID